MFDREKYVRYGINVSGWWVTVLFFIGMLYTGLKDVEPLVHSQFFWSFVSVGLTFTIGLFAALLWLDFIKWKTTQDRH